MRRIRISALIYFASTAVLLCAQSGDADVTALIQRAVQLQQAGDNVAAAEAYRDVLKLRPDDAAAHVNLGVVLVKLGRFDEALPEYEAAEKLLRGDPRIALNIALAYEKSGRTKEATERFEALHTAAPQNSQVTMLLADCHLQLGDDERVIELLKPMEAQNSKDLGFAYMLGMALLHKQRIQEGQVLLDRILRNGDTAEARFLLGTRMFESGDYPAAVKQLAGAIALNPRLPQLQSFYGQALLNTGDAAAATEAFRKELATNPNDYRSNLGLGEILTVRKLFPAALPLLQRALQMRRDSAAAKLAIAQCLIGTGQFQEALSYAEAAASSVPQSADAHEVLSTIYKGLRRADDSTRERSIAESLEQVSDPGPKIQQIAPDFELSEPSSRTKISLHSFNGKSPVVLVFGSYSCPNFRSSAEALNTMYQRYGARVSFLLIYIREAHSNDQWQSTRNTRENVMLAPATTFGEKENHAVMCRSTLHLRFPALVDATDGTVEKAYNAWPSRVFIIGEDGRILYSTRLTELNFHSDEMEAVLRKASAHERAARQ